jgi:hypothetical protein
LVRCWHTTLIRREMGDSGRRIGVSPCSEGNGRLRQNKTAEANRIASMPDWAKQAAL